MRREEKNMKWINKPEKSMMLSSAHTQQKICWVIICGSKPCSPVACSNKCFP